MMMTRRRLLGGFAAAGAASALPMSAAWGKRGRAETAYAPVLKLMDTYAPAHLREYGVPGLMLGMASRDTIIAAKGYGYNDTKLKTPVSPQHQFQVGSVSKSFIGLTLLALWDEGKLDFHKPVTDYLPWLKIKTAFAPVTAHHLLTHSSGLLNNGFHFTLDPQGELEAAYAPGERYYYSNMAYAILGMLIEHLDRRSFTDAIQARILDPLGMRDTTPMIGSHMHDRMATSYVPLFDDRPVTRTMPLREVAMAVTDMPAGSVTSTAGDMARYVQMITRGGQGPNKRIVSEAAFKLFSTPYVKVPAVGPDGGYGYGIIVDLKEGRNVLRHTGGMISFSSAMWIDMAAGVGAFASVNARRGGYRPNHVADLAMKALAAVAMNQPLPAVPPTVDVMHVATATDYAGSYSAHDGSTVKVVAENTRLFLVDKGRRIPLESTGGDRFIALHPDWSLYPVMFERSGDAKSPVAEMAYGGQWFAGERYTGQRQFPYPKEWDSYTGLYRNAGFFHGGARIVIRKGKLLVRGTSELSEVAPGVFRPNDPKDSPERLVFTNLADGKAWRFRSGNEDYWRVRER